MTIFPLSKASSIRLCSMSPGDTIVSFSLRNEEQLCYRLSDRKDLRPHQTTLTIHPIPTSWEQDLYQTRRVSRRSILGGFSGLPLFFHTVQIHKNFARPCEKLLGCGWWGSSLLSLEVEESYPCSALLARMRSLANCAPVLLQFRLLSVSSAASNLAFFTLSSL